ncbi:16S rRNA (guanine(966)-N(2))-methyltransferase RsmD [Kordiimonas pumila]|uniref:16S rRNA (Guanine(966)-N(2))-methyltransferase RsmD n=1 Tax=Kordiimonas pumila TaxID=2161677 RepID=A0ABV7D719_9PROT|nr:16S rRNA (guanine(966)-N(2))-methyltransferase RsmD [Kordiimonas pumila]
MTRIIAGTLKGRNLVVPAGRDVRPTTDRMRERIFSMLLHGRYPDMKGANVLDLYAGTGALGLEALSRGAARAVFVENARASIAAIKENIKTLRVEDETEVRALNASLLPTSQMPFDIIFMDPPYNMGLVEPTLTALIEGQWLSENGVIVCELSVDDNSVIPAGLDIMDDRKQGQQRILFLQKSI